MTFFILGLVLLACFPLTFFVKTRSFKTVATITVTAGYAFSFSLLAWVIYCLFDLGHRLSILQVWSFAALAALALVLTLASFVRLSEHIENVRERMYLLWRRSKIADFQDTE